MSLRDSPLAGANISLAESPYKILNRSQENGYFVVDTFCIEKEKDILVTRHGYVPQLVKITNLKSALKVKMEKSGMFIYDNGAVSLPHWLILGYVKATILSRAV